MAESVYSKWLTNFKVVLWLVMLGLFIYLNALGNGFFADDYHQIIDNPTTQSLTNIPGYFTGSTFYTGGTELSGNYYKPLLTTAYSLMYAVFGANATGYHFVQVLLHIANAILVFFFCKFYFNKLASFLVSVLFLTHPINNEVVVYIANLQDSLFLFFGLAALTVNKVYSFLLKPFVVGVLLLLSLLSKETGLLFLAIVPLDSLLANQKQGIRDAVVSVAAFAVYGYLRFMVALVFFNEITTAPIMQLSIEERLMHIPGIIFFYISTFFFPKDLIIFQTYTLKSISFTNFYLPLLIDVLFFIVLLLAGVLTYMKAQYYFKTYLFFVVWFLLGLLLHLQIFPLDGTVADRWFYFPIIGLLGMLAVIVYLVGVMAIKRQSTIRTSAIIISYVVVCIFSVRVMVRNTDWKDQMTLINHDMQYNNESYQLEEGYGLELMKQGNLNEAYPHLLRSTEIFPGVNNLTSLGVYYGNAQQFDKAKATLERAMQYDESVLTYENYALILLLNNDIPSTEEFAKRGVQKFPQSYKLWLYLALSAYGLGHDQDALQAATNAYSLKPGASREYVLNAIKNNERIDISKL